ncbi:L-amino-acid oxidase [Phlyctema vagabunda]|uniref:L-amino-acid oxidase n=1 Tax=Phlyctema vagabunda TaxID=108571 RepID=A0ABR4PRZ0_9HELO
MGRNSLYLALGALLSASVESSVVPRSASVDFLGPFNIEVSGVHNIHIAYNNPLDGDLSIHYGDCDRSSMSSTKTHHQVGKTSIGGRASRKRNLEWQDARPERFVWVVPADTPDRGCLHAYINGDELVGASQPIDVVAKRAKRSIPIADYVDAEGPWFDGVEYITAKEPDDVFVAKAKGSTIGILGGGMSGLMSAHILDSVGLTNWEILEASSRIGGRVHTSYLNGTTPDEYQYQEMGPMRFPVSITDPDTNETITINDHKMVFQLAEKLNEMNGHDPAYAVNFIPWIQSSANTPVSTLARRPDGTIPGRAEVAANPSLAANTTYSNATAVEEYTAAYEEWLGVGEDTYSELAKNIFKVHKEAVDNGVFDFSESEYIRFKLGASLNITDEISGTGPPLDSWFYEDYYFQSTTWRTIDQGLSKLPAAFGPQVLNRTRFQTVIQEMSYDESTEKVKVSWRPDNPFDMVPESQEFDYVITAVPFSKVRLWRLPEYSSLLSRAINSLNYQQACKVALHYETRFWEHLERPIIGGCGSVDIPGIGSVCYPAYTVNATGPGVLLASYFSGVNARTLGSMSEIDHVALVQRAMIETHGSVAEEQFTGAYDRICWENNEFQAGAWVSPLSGQQALYLPAYFRTEFHTVFVGEHTSYTHAWIWSALESAVRGTTQLLLEMGLVDEAKSVTEDWMARWISV